MHRARTNLRANFPLRCSTAEIANGMHHEEPAESLNPAYGIAHRSGMCVGDEHCEIRIEPKR